MLPTTEVRAVLHQVVYSGSLGGSMQLALISLLMIPLVVGCGGGDAEKPTADADTDTDADADADDTGTESTLVEMDNGEQDLMHDGMNRKYWLYQPDGVGEDAPLVLVMHGYSGNAADIQRYSKMNDVADEHGFVVAYPQGTRDRDSNRFFNVGYAFHPGVTIDDVGFVKAIVSQLQSNLGVSEENVFATGMSNGGEMSYMLACQAADVFKSVASVSGIMFESFASDCTPARPISIFEIHGTDDSVNWYGGDPTSEGGWGPYRGIENGIDFWTATNELNQQESSSLPDTDPSDGSDITFVRHWSADSSIEVWLYRVNGGGHDWPGAWGNRDMDSSESVWSFFGRNL
jgi:polyhydroxybutyrate depolymerase